MNLLRASQPVPSARAGRALGAIALGVGLFAIAAHLPAAPDSGGPDEAPVLVSTTDGGGGASLPTPQLQKKAAAGDAHACYQLGLRCETGDEAKPDYAQARHWYEQAAAGGVADAIYRLGHLYQQGLGVDADPLRAYQLYRLAALADVPLAQYNLGAMLVGAHGVSRDWVNGLAWLILAARHQVAPEGEQKTRAYLAPWPKIIAAAEARAKELTKEVAARHGQKPPWPPPADDGDGQTPGFAPPQMEKPKLAAPVLEAPALQPLPPPSVAPPAVPPPELPADQPSGK